MKKIERRELHQQHDYAELQIINMGAYSSSPSPNYAVDLSLDQQAHVSSLKASKLSQILRRWRAQSRKQATSLASAMAVSHSRSSARPPARSRLTLVPLRCLSMQLHSDDEDGEENRAIDHTANLFTVPNGSTNRGRSPRFRGSASQDTLPARRALSCPKLGSPLSSCTPFSSIQYLDGDDEELECLQPRNEGSIGSNSSSKGSSPLKHGNLSKQPSTPKGYVALYVGEERKRFLVKASLVNHPLFGVLLEKAQEEFGFEQKGPLNIPCEIGFFQHVMLLVESDDPLYRNADRSTILLHLKNNLTTTAVV